MNRVSRRILVLSAGPDAAVAAFTIPRGDVGPRRRLGSPVCGGSSSWAQPAQRIDLRSARKHVTKSTPKLILNRSIFSDI